MAWNEAVLVENAVSKLYNLQFTSIGISKFLNEHFQLGQFHLKPSTFYLEDLFSSVLSQFKEYHPSGNLKINNLFSKA